MAFRYTTRASALARAATVINRGFHSTRIAFVKAGDTLPSVELMENSPGNKVNLAQELKGKNGIVIGVPAAFSPGCSAEHIPSYAKHPKLKDAGDIYVVSVNDAFVMNAWAESMKASESGMRYLGDPSATFTKALELDFDGTAIFGGPRSKRYALVIEEGKVKSVHVEPDAIGTNVSMAEKVLG